MPKPTQTPGAVSPVDDFLRVVLRSGLLDRAALQAALRSVPAERRGDVDAVADHLVRAGKLTRFQARKLVKGASFGLVLGHYQVLAPIARGGMGTVYMARDMRSELVVALKILPPRRAREEVRLLTRFRREMEMCQRVSHPHLAWTYEGGVHRGVYYIAMEYIPGRSLYRVIAEDGPLPVPRAARLFAEVALAIDHAHNQGLIHRDLKPSNVIITPNDHAKVLDLGLAIMDGEAKTVDREVIGGQGYVLGTMDYIAPEQTDDPTKVDVRCDVYALGCSLYYTLTGRPPFPGGTSKEKIQKHRTEEPADVGQLNPQVPAGFVDLVKRMMAKSLDARLPSAAVLRHELLRWADKGPGLPLDRPEDDGYRRSVSLVVDQEPSSDAVAETLPAPESAPAVAEPLSEEEPVILAKLADEGEDAPVARPVKAAPRRPPPAPPGAPRPALAAAPGMKFYVLPVAVGAFVGALIVALVWFFVRRS